MIAIIKKELKSYLLTPIGYIFIGLFLLMFSLFFYEIYKYNVIKFEYLFYNGATILTFITPVLTMRMFAEERKNGTEQLILTSPVSIAGVVFGKFLAALNVIFIALLVSFMYFGIICYFGSPNIMVLLVTMLGFLLISGAAISLGMFASSITENQIIAGIITIAFLIMSLFIPDLGKEFQMVSIMDFYQKFPTGVISLTEVVGAVSFAAMFIAFTIIVMQRRKLVK
jgi:ABC-2 type transport system permease protein